MSAVVDTVATVTTRVLIEAVGAIIARASADEAAAIERQIASLHSRSQRSLGPRLDEIRDAALARLELVHRAEGPPIDLVDAIDRERDREQVAAGLDPYASIPRRQRIDLMVPAELAIRAAVGAVEAAGADTRLTDAITALHTARALVADVVDDPKASR